MYEIIGKSSKKWKARRILLPFFSVLRSTTIQSYQSSFLEKFTVRGIFWSLKLAEQRWIVFEKMVQKVRNREIDERCLCGRAAAKGRNPIRSFFVSQISNYNSREYHFFDDASVLMWPHIIYIFKTVTRARKYISRRSKWSHIRYGIANRESSNNI